MLFSFLSRTSWYSTVADDDEDFSPLFQRQNPMQSIQSIQFIQCFHHRASEWLVSSFWAFWAVPTKVSSEEQYDWLNSVKIFFLRSGWLRRLAGGGFIVPTQPIHSHGSPYRYAPIFSPIFLKSGVQREREAWAGPACGWPELVRFAAPPCLLQVRRRFPNLMMLFFFLSFFLLAARRIGHAVNTPSTEILLKF